MTVNRTLGCTGVSQAALRPPHGDGWRGREIKGCRDDVRSPSATLVSSGAAGRRIAGILDC